jgi:hypothetical protein
MSEFERPSDASAQARPRADVDAGVGVEDLPRIDEHTITIRVDDPMLVWNTLGEVIGRLWRVPSLGTRLLQAEPAIRSGDPLLAGSTLPGFTVVRAEPGKELALGGHHRFSSYALIFRLVAGERHTTLSAETRATFPGAGGRVYRRLVIGTRGHILVVRALLRATRRRAQQR